MPHLTLEYTRNLVNFDAPGTLAALNTAMFDSGLFCEPDIKSRAIAVDDFVVGIRPAARAFAHVRIALLSGRSSVEREELAAAVLGALQAAIAAAPATETQLSVETFEIDRPGYAKAVLHAG